MSEPILIYKHLKTFTKFFKRYSCKKYFHGVWINYKSTLNVRSHFSLRFLICLLNFISLWFFLKQKDELFISNQKIFQQNLKVQSITFQHVSHHKSMHFIPVIILLYGMFYSFGQSKSEMHSGIYTHTYCTKFSTSTCILQLWEQKKNYKLDKWMFILI